MRQREREQGKGSHSTVNVDRGSLARPLRQLGARPVEVGAGALAGAATVAVPLALAARGLRAGGIARWFVPVAGAVLGAAAGALLASRWMGVGPSARPRRDGDDLRVVTINIHQGVPDGFPLGDEHEQEAQLRDVARYIRDIDADVVLVQEVDDDRPGPAGGVPGQFGLLGSLMGADDAEFAAAITHANGDRYGIATYTRNGITLEDAWRETLPHTSGMEARQLLVADAVLPDGRRVTVANTHLDHTGIDRPGQVAALGTHLAGIEGPLIAGGDLNASAGQLEPHMGNAALGNVMSSERVAALRGDGLAYALAPSHGRRRIDHLYSRQGALPVADTWIEDIPMHGLEVGTAVSDHRPVVADFRLPAQAAGDGR